VNNSSPEKLEDHHPQKKEYQSEYFLLSFLFFFEYFYDWGITKGHLLVFVMG